MRLRLLVWLLLCLPALAQPLELWRRLEKVEAAAAQALIEAESESARLLYQELLFEAVDCKLYSNAPFSPRAEEVRQWLVRRHPESAVLEGLLSQEKPDFSSQQGGLGGLLKLYQQVGEKPEYLAAGLAQAERLQVELAVAAFSLERETARAEAIWERWQHPLGLILCDVLRAQAAASAKNWDEAVRCYTRAAGRPVPAWQVTCYEKMAAVHKQMGQPVAAASAYEQAIELQKGRLQRQNEAALWKKLGSLETLRGGALAASGRHAPASLAYGRGEEARARAYQLEKAELEQGLEVAARAATPEAVYVASDTYLYLLESLAGERNDWETRARVAQRRVELARARADWKGLAQALEAQSKALIPTHTVQAQALAAEALEIRKQKLGGQSLYRSLSLQAEIARHLSHWDEALALYQQLVEQAEPGVNPPLFEVESAPENLQAIYRKSNLTERQAVVQSAFFARLGRGEVQHIRGNYRAATEEFVSLQNDLGRLLLAGLADEELQLRQYRPGTGWRELYARLKDGPDKERLQQGRLIADGLETVLVTHRAGLLSDQGDLDGAAETYRQAIEDTTRLVGGSFPLVGAYTALANIEMDRGHYEAAEGPLQTALEQYVRQHNSPGTASALGQLSALRRRQGRTLEAVQLARQGLELAETLRDPVRVANLQRSLGLAEAELGGLALNDAEQHLGQAIKTYRELGLRSALAYSLSGLGYTLERGQRDREALAAYREAVGLVELLANQTADAQTFNSSRANAELYDRLIRLLLKQGQPEESFRYLERFKAKALVDAMAGLAVKAGDPRLQAQWERVHSLAEELRRGEGQLSASELSALEARYRAAVKNLAQSDPGFAGLVSVSPAELSAIRTRLPAGTLLLEYFPSADRLWTFAVSGDRGPRVFSAPVPRQQLMRTVSDYRVALKERRDCQELSARLYDWLIRPAEAEVRPARNLVIVPGGELYHLPFQALWDGSHYLIESKPVAYAAQADLLPTRAPAASTRPARLLAMGNPDRTLPAASREVREISRLFAHPEVYLEGRATLSQLARSRRSPTYLHLATHGIFNGLDPKESSLVLAGGGLRVRDLLEGTVRLPLQGTRLVTLSACQTHLGGNDPGALYGSLSRAFTRVGAPSVMASLWSVEDESTRRLMNLFYARLAQGKGRAEALALAERQLLKQSDYAHPYFWAAFVLMGEWR